MKLFSRGSQMWPGDLLECRSRHMKVVSEVSKRTWRRSGMSLASHANRQRGFPRCTMVKHVLRHVKKYGVLFLGFLKAREICTREIWRLFECTSARISIQRIRVVVQVSRGYQLSGGGSSKALAEVLTHQMVLHLHRGRPALLNCTTSCRTELLTSAILTASVMCSWAS